MSTVFKFFINRPKLAFLISFMIILLGLNAAQKMKREMFPKVDFGTINIFTNYKNASPADIELKITNKIENALDGLSGIKKVYSSSTEGTSRVTVILDLENSNNAEVKNKVRDSISKINDFPSDLDSLPTISIKNSSLYPLMEIGFTSKTASYKELKEAVDQFELKIKQIGVSKIEKIGYLKREIHIEANLKKMATYNITPDKIAQAIKNKNIRQTLGSIDPVNDFKLTLNEEFQSLEDVKNIIIQTTFNGKPIYLKDICTVKDTFEKPTIITKLNGIPSITLMLYKNESKDIINLSNEVEEYINEQNKSLKSNNIEILITSDFAYYIKNRLNIVLNNGLLGLVFVIVLLTIFLNFRLAIWVALGIPVSIFGTLFILSLFNFDLDIISLAAFIIVLGIIVDDGIIVAENILHLKEKGMETKKACIEGITQVYQPVVTTILTTIIAFAPMMFIPGIMGEFIVVIPLIISISLLVSLIEVTIALPAHLLSPTSKIKALQAPQTEKKDSKIEKIIEKTISFKYIILISFILLCLISGFLATKLDFELFSKQGADQIDILFELPKNKTLSETTQKGIVIENLIKKLNKKDYKSFATKIGATFNTETELFDKNENKGSISIYLYPLNRREMSPENIIQNLRKETEKLKGFTSIKYRVMAGGPPVGNPITVRVISPNDVERNKVAKQLYSYLDEIEGVKDLERNDTPNKDEIRIKLDFDKMSRLGLNTNNTIKNIRLIYQDTEITNVRYDNEDVKFLLSIKDKNKNIETLLNIKIPNEKNQLIPLKRFASIQKIKGSQNFYHFNFNRSITLSSNIDETKTSSYKVTKMLKEYIKTLSLENTIIKFGGESKELTDSLQNLKKTFIVAVIGIYLLLVILFNSFIQPFFVISAIPFAIIGVIIAYTLHQETLGFMSILGIVGLTGIVVNDSLVLVHRINYLKKQKHYENKSAIIQATKDRIRPIVTTTLTTAAGVTPLAYGLGGYDPFIAPMALSLGVGIIFATPLIIILIPIFYDIAYTLKKKLKK